MTTTGYHILSQEYSDVGSSKVYLNKNDNHKCKCNVSIYKPEPEVIVIYLADSNCQQKTTH